MKQKQKKCQDSGHLEENIEKKLEDQQRVELSKQEQGEGDGRQGCKQKLKVEQKKEIMPRDLTTLSKLKILLDSIFLNLSVGWIHQKNLE